MSSMLVDTMVVEERGDLTPMVHFQCNVWFQCSSNFHKLLAFLGPPPASLLWDVAFELWLLCVPAIEPWLILFLRAKS